MSDRAVMQDKELDDSVLITQDEHLGRPVRILWVDSGLAIGPGWQTIEDVTRDHPNVLQVETVGLWCGENEHVVMVCQSRDVHNQNWNQPMVIWKPSLVSKEWLS